MSNIKRLTIMSDDLILNSALYDMLIKISVVG